nr:Retrovirus-related Pol polyprotein from transposon RE2 [Ipomoea batatas]
MNQLLISRNGNGISKSFKACYKISSLSGNAARGGPEESTRGESETSVGDEAQQVPEGAILLLPPPPPPPLALINDEDEAQMAPKDSDWGGVRNGGQSITCYVLYLGSNIISLSSVRQKAVTRSSIEVEYRPLANAAVEVIWNPVYHSRIKHLALGYVFVRDHIVNGTLCVQHVPNTSQIADILIKGLGTRSFEHFRSKMGVSDGSSILRRHSKNEEYMMQPYEEENMEDMKNKMLARIEELKQEMANIRERDDNDVLESFTFDDKSLSKELANELHDMLCNVDDELNVDACLLDLNDIGI